MSVTLSGPFFTGQADAIVNAACRRAQKAVATTVQGKVQDLGQASFRYEKRTFNVPGKWRSNIKAVTRGAEDVVTDSGIIYGAWLEGTGSRNRTTRFKGYFMWRRVFQEMNRGGAVKIVKPYIDTAVAEINA